MLAAWLVLLAAVAIVAYDLRVGSREFERLKASATSGQRVALLRRWFLQSLFIYGLGSLLGLAVVGRLDALATLPTEFRHVPGLEGVMAPGGPSVSVDFLMAVVAGAVIGGLVLAVAMRFLKRRTQRGEAPKPATLGDFEALLPRNAEERWWGLALSVNAGVSEELFYRLLLPLLFADVLGNTLLALAFAIALFGLVHAYQGWKGILATTMVGAAMTFLYLATGNLWLVMLLHALIDINGLLLQPWLVRRLA